MSAVKPPRWLPESLNEFWVLIEAYGEFDDEVHDNGTHRDPATCQRLDMLADQVDAAWKRAPLLHRGWANVCEFVDRVKERWTR